MSTHRCDVIEVRLEEHENADALSVVRFGGYQCVVKTADWNDGDLAVYVPPDSLVPTDREAFSFLKRENREKERVKVVKLRGVISQGLLIPAPDGSVVGDCYMEYFGVEHYEPPLPSLSTKGEDVNAPSGVYPKYDVENLNRYNKIIQPGENVVVTEKIHGCLKSDTRISMPDGTRKRIVDLVKSDYNGCVLGFDHNTASVVTTKVLNTFNNGLQQDWLKISFNRHMCGRGSYFGAICCTPNHQFYIDGKYIAADELKVGNILTLIRSEWNITPVQEQVLIGKMMGDASYQHNDSCGCISFGHEESFEEYLRWTEQALGSLCGNRQGDYISGYGSLMKRSRTSNNSLVKGMFDSWIIDGQKEFPASFIDKLNPIAMSFWYMDDGSLSHNEGQEDRVSFATNGFSEESVKNICKALGLFQINATMYESKGWRIRLNSDDAEKFFLLVAPYVPPIMQYKLPERYRGHPGWIPDKNSEYKPYLCNNEIIEIESISSNRSTYDLETETHNYFANGVLVHNSNARFTLKDGEMYAGSRTRWKKFWEGNLWWKALAQNTWIEYWCKANPDFTIYGEVFGNVQSLKYGAEKDDVFFRAFDVWDNIENRWLSWNEVEKTFASFDGFDDERGNVFREGWVPILYEGPFDETIARELAEGDSSIPGANHYREGVVVCPVEERWEKSVGRVQLKIVGNRYLMKS